MCVVGIKTEKNYTVAVLHKRRNPYLTVRLSNLARSK